MLLFILHLSRNSLSSSGGFNTSHVTLYHGKKDKMDGLRLFQYITCYSLSLLPSFLSSRGVRFNTSHVTLYRYWVKTFNSGISFQYITCYSLSKDANGKILKSTEFQYITCYSLSHHETNAAHHGCPVSIHHMLLFIWREP